MFGYSLESSRRGAYNEYHGIMRRPLSSRAMNMKTKTFWTCKSWSCGMVLFLNGLNSRILLIIVASYSIYHIYPKYWDTDILYHTYPSILASLFYYLLWVSKNCCLNANRVDCDQRSTLQSLILSLHRLLMSVCLSNYRVFSHFFHLYHATWKFAFTAHADSEGRLNSRTFWNMWHCSACYNLWPLDDS